MGRREARESAFQLIYERIITGEKNPLTFELFNNKNAGEADYLESVYCGVDEKLEFLLKTFARYAKGFTAERIYKVDLSLLLLSAYEILFVSDIPDRVSVNEVLELVKVYSTEKSGAFINGILASVIKDKDRLLYEWEHPEEAEEAEETKEETATAISESGSEAVSQTEPDKKPEPEDKHESENH